MRVIRDWYSSCEDIYIYASLSCLRQGYLQINRLETLNGIIFHHISDNPNVVYAILRAHKTFEDLGTFTLAKGLKEIQRIQQAKEEQQGDIKNRDTPEGRRDEKAVLLERERERESEDRSESVRNSDEHGAGTISPPMGDPAVETEEHAEADPDVPGTPGTPRKMSEKVRGKMRARSTDSVETTISLERLTLAGVSVGRNGFVPTQEWVSFGVLIISAQLFAEEWG